MSHVEWFHCRSCSFLSHQLPQYVIGCPLPKHVVQIGRSFYSIVSYHHFDSVVQQHRSSGRIACEGGGALIPRLALRKKRNNGRNNASIRHRRRHETDKSEWNGRQTTSNYRHSIINETRLSHIE